MTGTRVGKSLYHLKIIATNAETGVAATATDSNSATSLTLMHLRCAYLNKESILRMDKLGAVQGMKLAKIHHTPDSVCEGCIFGKMKRLPFKIGRTRATKVGEILHCDSGFSPVKTPEGETSYILIKDDFSEWTETMLMKRKSEAEEHLVKFIAFIENVSGNSVKIVRTDGGTEFNSSRLKNFFITKGIVHQTTTPYTPQQNGVSERMNRTVMESARSSMHMRTNRYTNLFKTSNNAKLELWGEFLKSSVYVLNRTLSCSSTITPFERLYNRRPNIANFRVIGCRAYHHVPDAKRKKLDPKGIPCWFVGYGEDTKGWILWNPVTRKFTCSRDVTFDEKLLISDVPEVTHDIREKSYEVPFDPLLLVSEMLGLELGTEPDEGRGGSSAPTTEHQSNEEETLLFHAGEGGAPTELLHTDEDIPVGATEEIYGDTMMSPDTAPSQSTSEVSEGQTVTAPITAEVKTPNVLGREDGKSLRTPQYNARYNAYRRSIGVDSQQLNHIEEFHANHATALFTETDEPQSYKQALESPCAEKWMAAFKEEFKSLMDNKTWRLVKLPPGNVTINCKWIGKKKLAYEGVPERYKGRLVAIGSRQRPGSYDEIFAPVPHIEAVRVALTEMAVRKLKIIQMDVKTAFLYADLDKTI